MLARLLGGHLDEKRSLEVESLPQRVQSVAEQGEYFSIASASISAFSAAI